MKRTITSVQVDGKTLDPSEYTIVGGNISFHGTAPVANGGYVSFTVTYDETDDDEWRYGDMAQAFVSRHHYMYIGPSPYNSNHYWLPLWDRLNDSDVEEWALTAMDHLVLVEP